MGRKSWTKTLEARGRTQVSLPTFRQTGDVKVTVSSLGDAATQRGRKKITFTVVDRRTVRLP